MGERERVGGSHPWRLDEGYTTVVHLKNFTNNTVNALAQIRYDGGSYHPDRIKLGPFQTVAIDIKQLRDSQKADIRGGVMPKDVETGQVVWFEHQLGSLIGRAEIENISAGIASSFSCQAPCDCPPSFSSSSLTPSFPPPSTFTGVPGNLIPAQVMETDKDYYNQSFGPYDVTVNVSMWSTTDPAVATISGAAVFLVGSGTCSVRGQFSATVYGFNCTPMTITPAASADATAVSVTFEKADGSALPSPLRVGITQTELDGTTVHDRKQHLRARVEGVDPSSVVIIGDSRVSVSNQSVNGSYKNFDVVGTTKSDNPGDAQIKALISGGGTAKTASVSVVIPGSIATSHDTQGGGFVIQNMALNVTTSPPIIDVPATQKQLVTSYIRWLTILVKDQFGDLIGDVYLNAEVSETVDINLFSTHQHLTSSSTYIDPVGKFLGETLVAASDTTAINNWLNGSTKNPLPSGLQPVTQTISVFIDHYRLQPDPAIANRTYAFSGSGTTSPPVSLTITWPN